MFINGIFTYLGPLQCLTEKKYSPNAPSMRLVSGIFLARCLIKTIHFFIEFEQPIGVHKVNVRKLSKVARSLQNDDGSIRCERNQLSKSSTFSKRKHYTLTCEDADFVKVCSLMSLFFTVYITMTEVF